MSHRPILRLVVLTPLLIALLPRSIAHADQRIYLPFAFGPACNFASPAHGPTPGPLPTLAVRRWEHVRPANDVQAMALDPRTGDVWSVGIDGVAKRSRDGVSRTSFTAAEGMGAGMGRDIAVAQDGTVWVADRDLWRRRPDGRWAAIEAPVIAEHVAVDRSGSIWVGGDSGVAWLGGECGWESPVRGFPFVPTASVTDILAAANGDVWVATEGRGAVPTGVAVRRADGRWESFDSADGLRIALGPIPMLAERQDGQIWALYGTQTYSDPLERMVAFADVLGSSGRWTPASMDGVRLGANETGLHAIAFDRAGRPWFGGRSGIYVPDDDDSGRWNFEVPGRGVAWASGFILDADGVAWVGSGTIARRLSDGTWREEWINGPEFPHAVAVDGAGVWMDTEHLGADGTWQDRREGAPPSLREINDIALAPDGVWFATENGIAHRTPDGAWTLFTAPDALGGGNVSRIVAATDGSVWAVAQGMGTGVFVTRHRPDGRWEPHSAATGLPSGGVRDVAVGGDGAVWVGIEDGATRHVASLQPDGSWTDVAMPVDLRTGGVLQMVGDASGALWLFGTEHGLVRRAADGTWDAFAGQPVVDLSLRDPSDRPHVPILAIGPDGSAWIGGRSGEVRVRRPDGAWRSLMLLDLSRARDIAIGPDGRAWMTMKDGGSPRVVEVGP